MSTTNDSARSQLLATMSILMQRKADTPDEAEKKAITRTMKALNREIDRLDQADLLSAAITIANAADAVERAVAAARTRPFDNYLVAIDGAIDRLGQIGGDMHRRERLPSADFPDEVLLEPTAGPQPPTNEVPAISTRTAFPELAAEYATYYAACRPTHDMKRNIDYYVSRLVKLKPKYEQITAELNGIPWQLVGIIHGMESGFDFSSHLHNGDPLRERTVRVPRGRPALGAPPFTWRQSAVDALSLKDLHQVPEWSLPRMLFELERYNGMGYRKRALPTPYLWSFSNLYTKGRYVRDHEFDANAVSKQCGAVVMLKALEAIGEAVPS
jgi:lysozyme family protein